MKQNKIELGHMYVLNYTQWEWYKHHYNLPKSSDNDGE